MDERISILLSPFSPIEFIKGFPNCCDSVALCRYCSMLCAILHFSSFSQGWLYCVWTVYPFGSFSNSLGRIAIVRQLRDSYPRSLRWKFQRKVSPPLALLRTWPTCSPQCLLERIINGTTLTLDRILQHSHVQGGKEGPPLAGPVENWEFIQTTRTIYVYPKQNDGRPMSVVSQKRRLNDVIILRWVILSEM